eukprot:TRINITY_DN488_c1_g2_i1.p2 TRINITY_DN488_c1_g2~~TRINITY_DN488_c1_g2_i1.p2  ORF type:complete len:312 (+),score=128.20 TRINITY_DN488_c1_g2_i1:55-990(+)
MACLKLYKAMWGVPELLDAAQRKEMFARVVAEGYEGVEILAIQWRDEGIMNDLAAAGLKFVGQIHTSSHVDDGWGGFLYMNAWDVATHLESLRTLGKEAAARGCIAINSHSGVDGWSVDQAREFLKGAMEIEKEVGVPLFHETHRRRLFWNPFQTRDILAGQEDLAEVKLNADLSHWACCLERCFATASSWGDNSDKVDLWWPEVLGLLKKHCYMIHARVGWQQGPQVADPAAPEYAGELAAHMYYWEEIVKAQVAAGRVSIIEPEHGPWPYQQSLPGTETKPTACIWKVNEFVKCQVRDKYPEWAAAATK